jgi:hypothetical protein
MVSLASRPTTYLGIHFFPLTITVHDEYPSQDFFPRRQLAAKLGQRRARFGDFVVQGFIVLLAHRQDLHLGFADLGSMKKLGVIKGKLFGNEASCMTTLPSGSAR